MRKPAHLRILAADMTAPFDIRAFLAAGPTPAEAALLAHAAAGTLCQLGSTRPDPADAAAPRIRAALLAHLVAGGSEKAPVAAQGVRLIGAVIEGALDLSFVTAQGETDLRLCAFDGPVSARRARIGQLVLSGSALPQGLQAEGAEIAGALYGLALEAGARISLANAVIGGQLALHGAQLAGLTAQGARIGASVHLRAGQGRAFISAGEVSLANASIDGQVACDGARLSASQPLGVALTLQGAQIAGDVFLRDQREFPFHATGEVRLAGARIGGQLDCATAEFTNPGGRALSAQRMEVAAEFFWQNVRVHEGSLHLPSARVGDLVDDLASWPGGRRTYLDGFTYDRITRDAPVDARTRLQWLKRCARTPEGRFLPQPYGQCAAVLHSMGHEAEARRVMEAQARLKGRARRAAARARGTVAGRLGAVLDGVWDGAARAVVGYGYAPFRALGWIAGLVVLASALSALTWAEGSMAPNNDLIAASEGWQALMARDCLPAPVPGCVANPAAEWNGPAGDGVDWEGFHPLAWGADLVVPVVEIGQTAAWQPSAERGPWGATLWWARWPLIYAGWIVSALAAAAVTGLIQRGPPGAG